MKSSTRNWVFLGDSLTEGIGSERVSHVTELVTQLRLEKNRVTGGDGVHHLRLRRVDPNGFDRFIRFNLAGYLNLEAQTETDSIWIWNLAAEGQTIETDFEWLPLVTNIHPELVVIFRGSLESIIRPTMLRDGLWPWWVPHSWRGYAAMDPRCYFSSTWWRKGKQVVIDWMKSSVRRKLLQLDPGKPLMDLEVLVTHYAELINRLRKLETRVLAMGLLPIDQCRFPGSPDYFLRVNSRLREVAIDCGAEFCDWGALLERNENYRQLFYQDSFHPNVAGAKVLAGILQKHLQAGQGV